MPESPYVSVAQAVVAIVRRFESTPSATTRPPRFPHIIGTGFLVDSDGLVATNAHVIRAIEKLVQKYQHLEKPPVTCLLFSRLGADQLEVHLEVLGVADLKVEHSGPYFGPPEGPDLALLHVKGKSLPTVAVDPQPDLQVGFDIGTIGFPMGTDALDAPGWLHQLSPTAQRGIISAVLPFACRTAHAFSVDLMTQGGASGSPVFSMATGKVIGVLYAGLCDFEYLDVQGLRVPYRVPTSLSYVVPSHYLSKALLAIQDLPQYRSPYDALTIQEMVDKYGVNDVSDDPQARWRVVTRPEI